MIKFLNLKDQITNGSSHFAFYDTVSNTVCSFGEHGQQVFSSIEAFRHEFGNEGKSLIHTLKRFIDLIPDDYFQEN